MRKHFTRTIALLSLGTALCFSAALISAAPKESGKGANLQKEARVSRSQAEKTALERTPNGTVKEGELEREGGRLIWSFDIATSGTRNITEIQVDAKNGKIVSQTTESPAKEAREAKKESGKEKQETGGEPHK